MNISAVIWIVGIVAIAIVVVPRLVKGGPSAIFAGSRVLESVFEAQLPTQQPSHKATLRVNRLADQTNPVQIALHTRSTTSMRMTSLTFAAEEAQLLAEHLTRAVPLANERVREEEIGRARPTDGRTMSVLVGGDWSKPVALRLGPAWSPTSLPLSVEEARQMSAALRSCIGPQDRTT